MSFASDKSVRFSSKKVSFSSPERLRNLEKPRKQRFDIENIEKTLRPIGGDYGLMKIEGSNTPFTRKAQSLDITYLRDRLVTLFNKQEDKDEDEDDIVFVSPTASDSLTFSPEKDSAQLSFLEWRKELQKADFTLPSGGMDMRRIMHDPGPSIPGVTIKFPPVSWPADYFDVRHTVLFDTEVED